MLRVSLRNLLTNKLRLVLTVAAVTLGVSFVAGTFVLSDTMVKAFDNLYAGITSSTDVVVKSRPAYTDVTANGGAVEPLDQSIVTTVAEVPGVQLAEGSVAGFALIVGKDGKPVQPGGAPTVGVSVGDPRLAGDFTYREGRAPRGDGETAIDAGTAKRAGFRIGDRVEVLFQDGRRTFTVVGVLGFGRTDSLLGATIAGFDLPTAQAVLGKEGLVDEIDVKADPGVSSEQLRARVALVLPDGVEALTGRQVASDGTASVKEALGAFTTVLLVFAGVSLLVGSFVIWNTFNVLVAQRRREVALLRAVGGTRRQVMTGVLVEAGVIGLGSGLVGLLGGVGLATGIRALLGAIGIDIPSTSPVIALRTVVVALAVGLLVTTVAAGAPARVATRVAPMEALRDAVPAAVGTGRKRRVAGWGVLLAGLVALGACAVAGDQRWATVGATLLALAGLSAAGPSMARGLARLASHGRAGGGWRLAARNVHRSSRRAAATALALAIGLTVVAAVGVAASSLKASVSAAVSGGNRSDLILEPYGAGSGFSPSVAELLRRDPAVTDVVELRETGARVDGRDALVTALDTVGLTRVIDLGVETGSLDRLVPGTVLVGEQQADDLGVGPGDTLTVTFPESGDTTLRVAGTFSKGSLINASYIMTIPDYATRVTTQLDGAVLLRTAPGLTPARARAAVQEAVAGYPNVEVRTPTEITKEAQASVDQLLGIVTALLLLAVVIAVLGIVNTLILSVVERTRELGVLRAVGATRRQVRRVVRRESVLMALLGGLTGIALGTLAGVALSRALVSEGVTELSVPVVSLILYLVAAVVVGVLAAIGPAARASKVDVLGAISAE